MFCASFLIPIPVMAVVLPPSEPEFQDIKITTSVDVVGSMSYESELLWELSNEILGANLVIVGEPPEPAIIPEPPLNPNGEVQSYVSYSEDTQANLGIISYRKDSEVNTKPLVGAQYNVQNERLITFTGIDAGTLLSSEDMMMDNVGTCIPVLLTCPFCNSDCCRNPAFCSKVETGSDLDMKLVAVHISGGIRNVNKAGDLNEWPIVPTDDEPALAQYLVQVNEMGQGKPSVGSVSTYLKISEGDSRSDALDPQTDLMQQLKVEETRSIKGNIDLFEYQMNFESKLESCCNC
jgi:hypothetical protein